MDDLINKWRKTVDNHNQKLQNIRESSLGASSSGKSKIISQKEQSVYQPRGRQPATQDDEVAESLQQQIEPIIKQKSEVLNLNDLTLKDTKENQNSSIISQNINKYEAVSEEIDPDLKFFTENILSQVFQDTKLKSKKQKQILELLQENPQISAYLSNKKKQEKKALSLEYDLKMSQVENGDISTKISELERQLHKSQVEVTLLDQQIEDSQRKIVDGDHCAQETGLSTLKYGVDQLKESQNMLQTANQQLSQSIEQERSNFQEKELVWKEQFSEMKNLIQQIS